MTAPGTVRPESMSAAAAARPRDPSGRVLLPIRCEVKFSGGTGYRKYLSTWAEVAGFLASPSFTGTKDAVKSIVVVMQDPDPGPAPDTPPRRRDARWDA